ncbi:MAG: HAD family hydrolase [Planctomycetota bacterium]|nr:MAG: HAD family hydrolase [Planctomycetota bacterium]
MLLERTNPDRRPFRKACAVFRLPGGVPAMLDLPRSVPGKPIRQRREPRERVNPHNCASMALNLDPGPRLTGRATLLIQRQHALDRGKPLPTRSLSFLRQKVDNESGCFGDVWVRYNWILWDFDGTLADTLPHAAEIYNRLAPLHRVAPIEDTDAVRDMSTREFLKAHRIPFYKAPRLFRDFLRLQRQEQSDPPMFPAVVDALRRLHAAGVNMGVVSSNQTEHIRNCLASHGVADCFAFCVGSSRLQGKHRAIRRVLRDTAASPATALYVGDEIRDIVAARKVEIDTAAVTWGLNTSRSLKEHGPTWVVEDPGELVGICLNE